MSCAAGGSQPAFGIDEEYAGRNDVIPGREPLEYFHAIGEPRTDFYLTRFENIPGRVHEDMLRLTRVDHSIACHSEGIASDRRKLRAAVHTGSQHAIGIRNRQ